MKVIKQATDKEEFVVPSIKKGMESSPSQLHSMTNPASRIRKDVSEKTVVDAILKHCKASKEQNASIA